MMKHLYFIFGCMLLAACLPMKQQETPDTLENQAIVELQQGNLDSAAEKLQKAMAASPQQQRWKSLNAMGIIESLRNNLPQAEASFAAADKASPDNAAILNNWGLALAIGGYYDEAIAKLMQAVEVAPPQGRAQPEMNLALVYALSGNEKPASMILRRYMEPEKIKENMKFYAAIRKDHERSKELLRGAYGLPPLPVIPTVEAPLPPAP